MTKNFNSKIQNLLNEARALELTQEEELEIKRAVEEYRELKALMDKVGITDPENITSKQRSELSQYKIGGKQVVFKNIDIGTESIGGVQLNNIKYKDRSKPENKQNTTALVYVNFEDTIDDLAAYIFEVDEHNKALGIKKPTVVINNKYVGGKLKDLYALISHEILHGVQRYKKHSPGYEQATEDILNGLDWDRIDYYTDPGELEVQIGEIAGNVRHYIQNEYRKYQQLNKTDGYPEKGWASRYDKILSDLKTFFSSPPENYYEYKKIKVPDYLKRSEEFLETITSLYAASKDTDKGFEKKKWEMPWRRLQRALLSVYEEEKEKYKKP